MSYTFLGKTISGRFTIPSGIVTTQVSVIKKIAREIPEIGVITTKSVGKDPRAGYREPVFAQYAPGCFMNAVGLTNPGAEAFAEALSAIELPADRFLLTSIFGGDVEDFVQVATILAPYSDGLELNLSCPHASGYGMAVGQNARLVHDITKAVKEAVGIPVIPKLTPNAPDITEIACAAAEGGADALCAINTVGPGYYTVEGHPVLTNAYGGMSGAGVLPIGLKCVREIASVTELPIIGCGGISSAEHVRAYEQAGAAIFGVGTGLIGLDSYALARYFANLQHDLEHHTATAAVWLQTPDMSYSSYQLVENRRLADDLSLLVFDREIRIQPGQFVFVWLPEIGEKPFSVLDDEPLTLSIQQRGCFSKKLCQLEAGTTVYIRGPYGVPTAVPPQTKPMLVCGGCGLAAVYQIAKMYPSVDIFMGAKDAAHLFYLEQARQIARVHVATEDGSVGCHGLVTDLLQRHLSSETPDAPVVFFNCGPEAMIDAVTGIEQQHTTRDLIYNSIDYVTKCGVGICGSCATPDGRRLCVDGPFMSSR